MTSGTVSNDEFSNLMRFRAQRLMCAVVYLSAHKEESVPLTRPLLGDLLNQASQVEELLDSYGARYNSLWHTFRSLIAAIKLFSNVSYELLHIQHSLLGYHLLPLEQDFNCATEHALEFSAGILIQATERTIAQALNLGLRIPELAPCIEMYNENLLQGKLEQNLATRRSETVAKTVTLLATAFLNLAAESKPSLPSGRISPDQYESYISGPVTEESLRSIEFQFHNLQSLYDTYVSKTETEGMDQDLPVLRGHISVVMHLLRTGKDFAHYYERHVDSKTQLSGEYVLRLVDPEMLLAKLMNYSVCFAGQYLASAEVLCQKMLQRYTEIDKIEVTVPQYRGFHVRPSTLVSKLVLHYGSKVQMEMDEEYYDAASPLELFRANETINAQKRRWLAQEIVRLRLVPDEVGEKDTRTVIREVVLTLAERGKIIIYEQPLTLAEYPIRQDAKPIEQVTDEIAHLMATGKIDIGTDLKIRFIGDKRVLADIRLLAECGYGEDNFGNNIPLPEGLSYLRR
ncbi:MAG: hypothetical protein JXA82_13515 [Sedimentisphaerales bacterium]|nr:hypothetical protein [Sedimentisphaerales bacterium]